MKKFQSKHRHSIFNEKLYMWKNKTKSLKFENSQGSGRKEERTHRPVLSQVTRL